MGSNLMVFTGHDVAVEPYFSARCHADHVAAPFVVLDLGDRDTTMHVSEPAHLVALGQAVAQAYDLLTAALTGQEPLPVEQTALT